jgi:hypothetical protein
VALYTFTALALQLTIAALATGVNPKMPGANPTTAVLTTTVAL